MTARTLQYTFEAIGTHWVLDMYGVRESCDEQALLTTIHARIATYTKNYSRFVPDSLVSHIAEHPGAHTLPDDALPLMKLYKKLYALSGGAVTPLIGTVLEQAGYDATYSLTPKTVAPPPAFDDVFSSPNLCEVHTTGRVMLDIGAAGKGYLVDIVGDIIRAHGITSFCVDAGSDMLYFRETGEALLVGLENPHDTTEAIGTVSVLNKSLCASAGSRRAWGEYHHVMNPLTLSPVRDVVATWALADSGLLADGLATALFFVDPAQLQKEFSLDYMVLYNDGTFKKSDTFPGEIFSA